MIVHGSGATVENQPNVVRLVTNPAADAPADHLEPSTGPAARAARSDPEAGMVTVEYAIGTIAAAALATLLWTVAHSPGVLALIEQVFERALSFPR